MAIGLTFAGPGNKILSFFGVFTRSCNPVSICTNGSTAQSYLNKTLILLTTLQANSTLNSILQIQNANFVSYIKNITNQALITSNCTAFIANVKSAQFADVRAERQREQLADNIQRQFQQAAHNATGSSCRNELDCDD